MNEHIRYEWQMLGACACTLKRLAKGMMIPAMIPGGEEANGQFFFNMVHEAFCLHARNLIEWKELFAYYYDMPEEIAGIMIKIEQQIVSLNPKYRTSKVEEKISDDDRQVLFEHIREFMKEYEA